MHTLDVFYDRNKALIEALSADIAGKLPAINEIKFPALMVGTDDQSEQILEFIRGKKFTPVQTYVLGTLMMSEAGTEKMKGKGNAATDLQYDTGDRLMKLAARRWPETAPLDVSMIIMEHYKRTFGDDFAIGLNRVR